jgi:hypothetical protein
MKLLILIVESLTIALLLLVWFRQDKKINELKQKLGHESWMHAACLSIAEGVHCVESDGAVKASLATRTVFKLRRDYEVERDRANDLLMDKASAELQVAKLTEALLFYADKSHWDDETTATSGGDEECKIITPNHCIFFDNEDGWTKATLALSASPALEPGVYLSNEIIRKLREHTDVFRGQRADELAGDLQLIMEIIDGEREKQNPKLAAPIVGVFHCTGCGSPIPAEVGPGLFCADCQLRQHQEAEAADRFQDQGEAGPGV